MHYQFKAIHPFDDGNGRTGHIFNILYLMKSGLLKIPVIYLSYYLIKHRREYYQYLLDITKDGKWEEWILYMLNVIEQTAQHTTGKIKTIKNYLTIILKW